MEMSNLWVEAAFIQDSEYAAVSDLGIQELAEHLAQWDYGDETDYAHTRDGEPWGTSDYTHNVNVGGLDYVLAINNAFGYASLNRRPLTA
ncbi:hypothetical protein J4U01_gp084 [Mycobacterium phage Kumao]|uniref:Uncharacterized protein n=1 Tax=Mycobacterium phage Kumao TaxID=2041344 RepID=A0A2D1GPZ7_9CAUD|nr:hypothetical protein J4U01_gp084 [Mycobacterium phage Kumao]ATN94074.1 hypothetical protein SEA_KUMAO_112 [Mycobacterium phage Kumao]